MAFLAISGSECAVYVQADVQRLKAEVEASSGDIDIFLTCEWPAGITSTLTPSSLPKGLSTTGQAQAALPPNTYASLLLKFVSKMPFDSSSGVAAVVNIDLWLRLPCHSLCGSRVLSLFPAASRVS